jgi:predicted HTH transcriptional regulator
MKRWVESLSSEGEGQGLAEFFHTQTEESSHGAHPIKDIKKTSSVGLVRSTHQGISGMSYRGKKTDSFIDKNARQDTILSFINDRKSVVIKDIVSLFPDVSEKTIQRELNKLVENGKITKRGSKRWSVYMAVNSLL